MVLAEGLSFVNYLRFVLVFFLTGLTSLSVQAQPLESSLKVVNYTYSYTTAGGASVTRTIPAKIYVPTAGTYDPLVPLPVVMYLHGSGERGNGIDVDGLSGIDSWAFSDSLQLLDRPAIYVAPRGIKDLANSDAEYLENLARYGSDYASSGEYWLNNYGSTDSYDHNAFPVSASLRGAMSLGDTLLTAPTFTNLVDGTDFTLPNIDVNRQYLVGWSAGGDGVWDAIVRNPLKYAAAIPVSGVGDPGAFASTPALATQQVRAFAADGDFTDQQSSIAKMKTAMGNAGGVGTADLVAGTNHYTVSNAVFGSVDNRNWLFAQSLVPEPSSLFLGSLGLLALWRRRRA
jgi:pimeloyl-ACP methyl ester carboxylesterase